MSLAHKLQHLFVPHHSNNQRARLLHPSSLLLILGLILTAQFAIRQTSVIFPQILGYASQISPSEIIRLTNSERQKRNLPVLVSDSLLTQAAQKKAEDMFVKDYWAHVSPIGTQPWFFITDAGYTYRYAGENLARDFTNPPAVIQAWIDSPSHRENLLNNRYQDIGVAVLDGKLGGRDTTLVVQMFGTKLSAATQRPALTTRSLTAQAAQSPQEVLAVTTAPAQPLAAEVSVPTSSPFEITKYFALIVLGLFAIVLILDIVLVNRRNLIRWTSKSFAHLIMVIVIITAVAIIVRGQIL